MFSFVCPLFLHLQSENPGLILNMLNHIWNIHLNVPRMAAWRPLLMNRYVPAAHCAAVWLHIFTNPTRTDAQKTKTNKRYSPWLCMQSYFSPVDTSKKHHQCSTSEMLDDYWIWCLPLRHNPCIGNMLRWHCYSFGPVQTFHWIASSRWEEA